MTFTIGQIHQLQEDLEKRLTLFAATNNLTIHLEKESQSVTGVVKFQLVVQKRAVGANKLEGDWNTHTNRPDLLHRQFKIYGKTFELIGWNERAYTRKVVLRNVTTDKLFPMEFKDFKYFMNK